MDDDAALDGELSDEDCYAARLALATHQIMAEEWELERSAAGVMAGLAGHYGSNANGELVEDSIKLAVLLRAAIQERQVEAIAGWKAANPPPDGEGDSKDER